jgi:hypothetical protein
MSIRKIWIGKEKWRFQTVALASVFCCNPRESLSRGLQQKIDAKATVSCEQILGPFLIWALSPWFSGNCSGFFLCFEISNLPNLHAVFIKMQCLLLRAFYSPSDQISYRYI